MYLVDVATLVAFGLTLSAAVTWDVQILQFDKTEVWKMALRLLSNEIC